MLLELVSTNGWTFSESGRAGISPPRSHSDVTDMMSLTRASNLASEGIIIAELMHHFDTNVFLLCTRNDSEQFLVLKHSYAHACS